MKKLSLRNPSVLKPYSNNPRKNDEAVEKVAESISMFGFQTPILCDEDFQIIAGHTRWKAALKLGLNKVPIVITDELSEEQKHAYRIADNRLQEFAGWDWGKLEVELENLDDEFIDILDFKFEELNSYLPNITPKQDNINVTQEQIDKTSDKLEHKFEKGKNNIIEVYCPFCGEKFEIEP